MRVAELQWRQIVREASEKEYTMHTDRNRLAPGIHSYDECPEVFTQEGSITPDSDPMRKSVSIST